MKRKIYMIVLCGVGDRPIAALGGRTPLEAGCTPNLDALAVRGSQAMVTIIDGGICPESDSGYHATPRLRSPPILHRPGCAGSDRPGIHESRGQRSRVPHQLRELRRAAGVALDRRTARDLSDEELQALVESVRHSRILGDAPGVESAILGFGKHRGIVCIRSSGRPLSANVSNTDPGFRKEERLRDSQSGA